MTRAEVEDYEISVRGQLDSEWLETAVRDGFRIVRWYLEGAAT